MSTPPLLLLFDMDGTLYDQRCGYVDHVHRNIFRFLVEAKGGAFDRISSIQEAEIAWQPIFKKYNLTKRGLIGEGYRFDHSKYDRFIRSGAERFIRRDPDLRKFLKSLPCRRKVIFTNAPEFSAAEILRLLGVDDLFEEVLGSDFLDVCCKPEREAFDRVMDRLGVRPEDYPRVWFFEDSYKNAVAGMRLGLRTVYVESSRTIKDEANGDQRRTLDASQFDAVIEGKVGMKLKEQIPELWK